MHARRSLFPLLTLLLGASTLGACATSSSPSTSAKFSPHHAHTTHDATSPSSTPPTPLERDVTLEALIGRSLAHHPALEQQHAAWKILRARARAKRYALSGLMLSYTFAPLPIETRLGAQRHVVTIGQRLPWPGTRELEAQALELMAETRTLSFDAVYLRLRHEVTQRYWQIWATFAQQRLLEARLVLLESIEQSLQARVEIGRRPASELSQIAIRKTRQVDRIEALVAQREELLEELLLLTHAPIEPASQNALTEATRREPASPAPLERTPEQVIESGELPPDLLAILEQEAAIARELDRQKLANRPLIEVGAQWSIISANEVMASAPGAGRDAVMLRLGITLPVWRRELDANEDAIAARIVANRAELDLATLQWKTSLHTTSTRHAELWRRWELLTHTLTPQAKTSLELTLGDYEAERADFSSMIAALNALLEVEIERIMTRRDLAIERSRWELLTGFATTTSSHHDAPHEEATSP